MSIWMAKVAATTVTALALGGLGAGIANASPATDVAPAAHPHHPGEHVEFSKDTKHGTVQIDLQRGVVTAVDGSSVTVKSTDGYTQSYTLTPKTHVRKDKQKSQDSAVAVGDRIGIAALAHHTPLDARWVRDHGPAPVPSPQPTPTTPITPAPSGS